MSAATATTAFLFHHSTTKSMTHQQHHHHHQLPLRFRPANQSLRLHASSPKSSAETVFFDGGAHYGDLLANALLGFTLVCLPLTLAAVSRAFFLRYRFTNLRVTVLSGEQRTDFSYKVVDNVQVVPRFIGDWGDIIITLTDGTKVELRSVPRFREIAKYCRAMAHINDSL